MPTTSMSDSEIAVQHFYEALSTGNTALVDDALAASWEAVPAMRTGPGSNGWKASIDHLRQVFPDIHVTLEDVLVAGERVAVRSVSRGTHEGELLGVPGTGRPIEFRSCDIHQVEDGRIVRTWHLEDYFGIAQQLGLKFVS